MRLLTFIASSYLFLGSTTGMLLAWMLNSKDPWLLDGKHNTYWLELFPESDIAALMKYIQETHPPLLNLIQLGYNIAGLLVLLVSLLLFGILFLAPRNRALNIMVHFTCLSWLLLFGWKTGLLFQIPRPGHMNFTGEKSIISFSSIHATLYWTLLLLNFIGSIAYLIYIYIPKKDTSKKTQSNEKKEN